MVEPEIKNVLVTGAGGFIGRHVCALLAQTGYSVRGTGRQSAPDGEIAGLNSWARIEALNADTDWNSALEGMDAVIHVAGRTHIMRDSVADPLAEYRRVNVAATETLARQSAQYGVKRFIFMSSVKVNGECTGRLPDGSWECFTEKDTPQPADAYAVSKWEAEQVLAQASAQTGMEFIILRPPLVYGPGVGANFLRLMRIIDLGWPLPFAQIKNQRSFIYVKNLANAVLTCLRSKSAAGRTYLVKDVDVSMPDLILAVGQALGRRVRLFGVPPMLLQLGAYLLLRPRLIQRLLDSLVIDDTLIRRELSWSPPVPMQEALARTVSWFRRVSWKA
ncbi:MAG: NAD-dependent epimerase/dehydratase family protein [Gammaproteobacteria bacterium]